MDTDTDKRIKIKSQLRTRSSRSNGPKDRVETYRSSLSLFQSISYTLILSLSHTGSFFSLSLSLIYSLFLSSSVSISVSLSISLSLSVILSLSLSLAISLSLSFFPCLSFSLCLCLSLLLSQVWPHWYWRLSRSIRTVKCFPNVFLIFFTTSHLI